MDLLRRHKTEVAAVPALGAIHTGLLVLIVFRGDELWGFFPTLTNPFLYCQFGLLAWWACLKGPRRLRRVVLAAVLAVSLFALASCEYVLAEVRPTQEWNWLFWGAEPWDDWGWNFYFFSPGGSLPAAVPFIFAAFVILGWIVPCRITNRRGRPDLTSSAARDGALGDWQFGLGDMLAGVRMTCPPSRVSRRSADSGQAQSEK